MEIYRYLVIAVLCSSVAWTTVNEPMRLEWLTGYRNDHLHWHLKKDDAVIARKRLSDLQFWENALQVRVLHRDLYVQARGLYALGKGALSASELLGVFGYAVNLTPDRTYKIVLVPCVGYGADYEWQSEMRMSWFGPFFGGFFLIQPGGEVQFETGYVYHRTNLHFSSHQIKVKGGSNVVHSGWARMDYLLNNAWRAGLCAQVQYFCSRVLDASHDLGKFKMRWTTVSGSFVLARRF